jgi:ribosomal protein S30
MSAGAPGKLYGRIIRRVTGRAPGTVDGVGTIDETREEPDRVKNRRAFERRIKTERSQDVAMRRRRVAKLNRKKNRGNR